MVQEISKAKAAAILAVIRQIDLYQGDVIVKEQHPLWMAVVALERLSHHNPRSTVQPYRLDPPAHRQWIYGLQASRPDVPTVPLGMDRYEAMDKGIELSREANPAVAIGWMKALRLTLVSFLSADESP